MINGKNIKLSSLLVPEVFSNCNQYLHDIAIIDGDIQISYEELKDLIFKMTMFLKENRIVGGDKVVVIGDNSAMTIILALGIFSIGAIYVPVDSTYPINRIRTIIKDSDAKIVIRSTRYQDLFPNAIDIDINMLNEYENSIQNENIFDEFGIAYIMYTSGSTGNPKGVMINHRSLYNMLYWVKEQYSFSHDDIFGFKTSISFTDSICEMFLPLICGGKIVTGKKCISLNPSAMVDWLNKYSITFIQLVPSVMKNLLRYVDSKNLNCKSITLKWVFNGGEYLSLNLAKQWNKHFDACIANIYGMTESTLYVSYYNVPKFLNSKVDIPIGYPINNMSVEIIDGDKFCGIKEKGEICVSGIGIAQGYWNNDVQTKKHFRKINDKMYYFTGDIGYFDEDNLLYYCGRSDNQVKINGMRVELSEIEKLIQNTFNIENATVICIQTAKKENRIICFVSNLKLSVDKMKEELKNHIPKSWIPKEIIKLDNFPININSKIDRQRLEVEYIKSKMTANRRNFEITDKTQYEVIRTIESILETNIENLDDTLETLGGHSLIFARITIELELLGIIIPIEKIGPNTTIAEILEVIGCD